MPPRNLIAYHADKMCREWWFFHGPGAVFPGAEYFWFQAENMLLREGWA